ncbi:MAG: hypothetical protein GYA24_07385 [Candidatus Lokiarchaeota archaeon]|nr:hypothetical protein [Candidatus Lokiarchaeota archaeon]
MGKSASIEQHAIEHHRYHSIVLRVALDLLKQQPDVVKTLFASDTDLVLFYNALRRAKVLVLTQGKIASGRRAPAKRVNPCLEYFCRYPSRVRLHFSSPRAFLDFTRFVQDIDIRTRSSAARDLAREATSLRQTGATPCFVLADRPIWARGVLNKEGRHVGNTFDMATFEGFSFFMHEAYHVMQWYRSPLTLLFEYVRAVVKSLALSRGHIPWAHELIGFEVEAMIFHNKLWMLLESWPGAKVLLSRFNSHR